MVLLDTHVWLWAAEGDTRRVGRQTRQLIAREERRGGVRISPASIFEVHSTPWDGCGWLYP